MFHFHPGRLALLVFLLGAGPQLAHAQATFTNNTISGTIRFSNVNPLILNQLNAPGNEGMSNLYVQASSLPPESRIASTDSLLALSRTNTPYQITVDSDSMGTLQCADSIDGPWTDLPGTTSPYRVPSDRAKKFYRVRE